LHFPLRQTPAGSIAGAGVGGSTDLVEVAVAGSMAAVAAGLTAGAMGAEAHGSTASRHLYLRPPLERVARIRVNCRSL